MKSGSGLKEFDIQIQVIENDTFRITNNSKYDGRCRLFFRDVIVKRISIAFRARKAFSAVVGVTKGSFTNYVDKK